MEENKFERQVQQKMDELQIQPSDSVWPKIEARLEKKRPSRRAFWLLLFACIFFAAGYFLWNSNHYSNNSNRYSNVSDKKPEPAASKKESNQAQAENNDSSNNNLQPKINPVGGSTNEPAYSFDKAPVNKNNSYKSPALPVKHSGNNTMAVEQTSVEPVPRQVTGNSGEKIRSEITNGSSAEDQSANKKASDEVAGEINNKVTPANLQKTDSTKNLSKASDTSKKSVASSASVIHKKKNKWQFGILLSGGISAVGNDFLGLANSIPYEYLNAVGQVTLPPGNTQVTLPSKSRSGFGFIVGVVAEKNISKNVKIITGINFKSFSTSNKVGTRNTSGYYSARATINNYNNHFDFIEVPVAAKVQLGKGKKIPLSWQGGLVVSGLISSNALQFNSTSGLYYKDNSAFNKSQLGLNTALSATVFLNRKTSLLIGPYFYYSVSKLAHDGLYNKKHFVFTGLSTAIIFGK